MHRHPCRLASLALVIVGVAAVAVAPVAAQSQPRPGISPMPPAPGRPVGAPTMGQPAPPPGSPAASPVTAPGAPAGTAPTPTAIPSGTPIAEDYVIGPGDVLQVTVWKNDTLSRVVPVRPDGKISMPLLHDIQAAGLTAMKLRDNIASALSEYLPNPEVSVAVNEVRSMRISVLGEVLRPGVLELRGKTTILEAIAMAGGFGHFASPSKITVIRTDGGGKTTRLRFNYNKATSGDEPNMVLEPGDVIIVP
jgi:polysaccharide export outer membrane protein